MKKLLPLLLAALLLLTACGGSNGAKANTAVDDMAMYAPTSDANYGWDAAEKAPMEPEAPSPEEDVQYANAQNTLPSNTKLILTADLELETKTFDSAAKALDQIVENLGGYYESHSLYQGGSYRSLSCTIRVPAASFSALLEQAGEAAHMTRCQRYSKDVSEAYYDTEARLQTQETKRERLQVLLEKASTMEDIIDLENALSETELEIEYLTGSLRKYDSLIGYSTVNLSLQEVYKLSSDEPEPPLTFGERLSSAFSAGFRRGVDGLEDFAIALARNWMSVLLLAAVAAAAVVLLRRRRRRKEAHSSVLPPRDQTPKN